MGGAQEQLGGAASPGARASRDQTTARGGETAAGGRGPNKRTQGVGKSFMAGAFAGASSSLLFQPFDVVKTHIQGSQASPPPRIRDVVRLIISRQGITGLWAGTVPSFLRVGIGAGLYFSMLGPVLSLLSTGTIATASSTDNLHKKLPNAVILGAGAITRSLAAFLVCPITVVKTRMEYEAVSGLRYPNAVKAIAVISRTEGLRGLYSGLLPTILRDAPYSGLYLLFYSSTRRTLAEWRELEGSSHMQVNFLAGVVAGASATILTHPPDVIRTVLQLDSRDHSSIFSVVRRIYQLHGIGGFFAGVLPRAGRRALHQAFSWTIYEEIMRRSQVSK